MRTEFSTVDFDTYRNFVRANSAPAKDRAITGTTVCVMESYSGAGELVATANYTKAMNIPGVKVKTTYRIKKVLTT